MVFTRSAEFSPAIHTTNAGGNAYPLLYLVFNVLVKIDTHDPLSDVILPDLAETWEASADARVFTFHLRRDAKWHDGEPFTAQDVAFTANWSVHNPDAIVASFAHAWFDIKGADSVRGTAIPLPGLEVLDDYTVRITLERPNALFLRGLANAQNSILPEHVLKDVPALGIEKSDFATKHPIGTGPYKVTKIDRDEVDFEANPDYFKGRPKIDKVIYRTLSTEATVAQLESGELGLALGVATGERARLSQNPALQVLVGPGSSKLGLEFYQRAETTVFHDKRVRQAFAYAIDRRAILESILEGQGRITPGVPPGFKEYPDLNPYPFDPTKAKELLDQANFDYSRSVRFMYPSDDASVAAFAPVIQQQLQAIGVKLELVPVDSVVWQDESLKTKQTMWDIVYDVGGAQGLGPDNTQAYFKCENPTTVQLSYGWCSARLDELFAQARGTTDPQKQDELYHEAALILNDEQPELVLWQAVNVDVATSKLHNFAIPPFQRWAFQDIEVWDLDQ